jgi:predicted dehydrogenase
VGQRGKHWARLLHEVEQAQAVGCVDINQDHLDWAQQQFGTAKDELFTDLGTALAAVEADAVILVTPPMVRYEQCLQIIEAGLPILAEKPLAMEFAKTLEVTRKAQEAGLPLVAGFNFRHLNVTQATKRILDNGEIGAPSFARVFLYWHRTGTRPGGNRYPLVMEHPMLLEQSVHALDLIRYVYGTEVRRLWTRSHNPPWSPYVGDATVTAILEMENGMLVNYLGTWMMQSQVREYDWRTDCVQGAIFQRSMFGDLFIAREGSDVLEPIPLEPEEHFVSDTRRLLQAFVDDLIQGRPPQPGGVDNLQTMALTCACIESAMSNEPVEMADFYRRHGVAPKELLV